MSIQIGKQYFEGFEEKFIPRANGKGFRKVRVYLGDIYRLEGSDRQWRRKKITLACCILAYFGLMVGCGSLRTLANVSVYVMLPYAVGLISGGYCAMGVWHCIAAPRDMTVFQYNEQRKQLKNGSRIAACAMAACSASNLICLILWGLGGQLLKGMLAKELIVLFSNMTCAALMASIHLLEKKANYILIPGKGSNQSDDWAETSAGS